MKCPGCGYESFDLFETCKHCGAPMMATAGAPAAGTCFVDDDAPLFRIDDDLFLGHDPAAAASDPASDSAQWNDRGGFWLETGGDLQRPACDFSGGEPGVEPLIDRYDEVPERCWAPEAAGLGRRALALLVDQSLLLAVLGVFFLAAFMALRFNGYETGLFLGAAGLQASVLPFALLAAVLSLAYYGYFHGLAGCTPGETLAGIEVRTLAGGALSRSRAILRWLGAALGLAGAGVGILWAIFEPRRRGWADLISGTVVARPRREPAVEVSRR